MRWHGDFPDDPSELLVPEHASQASHAKILERWRHLCNEPCASLRWAEAAVSIADNVSSLLRGRSQSIKGYAALVNGDYRKAEIYLYRAEDLLSAYPKELADNARRLGRLRMMQGSFAEARRLFEGGHELSRRHGDKEQIAKSLIAIGYLDLETGRYEAAGTAFTEALQHADRHRLTYFIAAHNLMVTMIMLGDSDAMADLPNTVDKLRKSVPRLSLDRVRLDWLLALRSIQAGSNKMAIKEINGIVGRLRRRNCGADEIAAALMDLAQAYYNEGDRKKACNFLEEARSKLNTISGICPGLLSGMDQLIVDLKEDRAAKPWNIRRRLATAQSYSQSKEHQETADREYVGPGNSSEESGWNAAQLWSRLKGKLASRENRHKVSKEISVELPTDPGELLTPEHLSEEIHEGVIDQWRAISNDPDASARWAAVAMDIADGISSLLCGRSESAMGYALLVNGKYREAEVCFHRAAALLCTHHSDEADNIRRIGRLRIAQKSTQEARRLFEQALDLSRSNGPGEQVGKNCIALGYLDLEIGRNRNAAHLFTEALGYLDHKSAGYVIAAHNLMVAIIMLRDNNTISGLVKKLNLIRKRIPRGHDAKLKLDWLVAIGLIPLGAHRAAIGSLSKIVKKLDNNSCPPDEIGAAFIDLSQAHFAAGDRAGALKGMNDARECYSRVDGISADFMAIIDNTIAQLETKDTQACPWDIRPLLGAAGETLSKVNSTVTANLGRVLAHQEDAAEETYAAVDYSWRSGGW